MEGAAVPSPYGGKILQVQVDIDQRAMQEHNVSAEDVLNAVSAQNLILPAGDQKIGPFDWNVALNASPVVLDHINGLPVKAVNGTVIYIRDVAFAHEGSPPQTNVVRVDGAKAVLMTILKAGAVSTLDVIDGVKGLLPRIKETLPSSINLHAVGDQSIFVRAAIIGVLREAVLAAGLVALMILLFLGSWRPTLIIIVSIPLSILFSLTALSWLGETINIMTLGGLALAIGMLVDQGIVTIESIFYHLEEGKEIEPAILDGAQQIVVPAFVTLLVLNIVFVPMFTLGGVAGYLFSPLAEAVVFALLASFILSFTLVPTMANYMLRGQVLHGGGHEGDGTERHGASASSRRSRNPFKRFQESFEHYFELVRDRYRSLLSLALGRPKTFMAGFFGCLLLSFGLAPFLGENFFPTVDSGQILMHVRAPTGTRIEETTRLCDLVEQAIRQIIPASEMDNIVDNIGLPYSGINMAYSNTGTIGPEDADVLISLKEGHAPTADYVKELRTVLPQKFTGATFAFLPADIVSQILNFGLPAPIDVQVVGPDREASYAYAKELLKRIRTVSGIADLRIQQAFDYPQINVDVDRSFASIVGLTQRDVANSLLITLSGSGQVRPNFWLNTNNGVLLSDRGPDSAISDGHPIGFRQSAYYLVRHKGAPIARGPCHDHPGAERRHRIALQRPAGHRHLRGRAGTRSRRGRQRRQQGPGRGRQRRTARHPCGDAGPGSHNDQRLRRALFRACRCHCACLFDHRRQFPIVARSVHHHYGSARGARWHRLDAVRDGHDPFHPGSHWCYHVHGNRDRE